MEGMTALTKEHTERIPDELSKIDDYYRKNRPNMDQQLVDAFREGIMLVRTIQKEIHNLDEQRLRSFLTICRFALKKIENILNGQIQGEAKSKLQELKTILEAKQVLINSKLPAEQSGRIGPATPDKTFAGQTVQQVTAATVARLNGVEAQCRTFRSVRGK